MELWEIAVLLGEGVKIEEKQDPSKGMVKDPGAFRRRNLELWKARQRGEKPEPKPMDPAIFGVIQKAQGA